MKINDSSNVIHFSLGNDSTEIKPLLADEFHSDLRDYVKIDGEYYHTKMVTTREMLNELIGTYYTNFIGGDASQYKIGICDGKMYALSKIFFKEGFGYTYPADYFSPSLSFSTTKRDIIEHKRFFLETDNLKRLNSAAAVKSILQMSAVDIKMNQADRHSYNIILRLDNGKLYIEKIFDFGWSYEIYQDLDSQVFYKNPFILVKKDYISLSKLANRYPEFGKCAATLAYLPVGEVLHEIEIANNVQISKEDYRYYREKDEEYSKVLRKI